VAKILEHAFGERMKVDELIQKIYDKKLFGKKSGKGFYIHPRKGKRYPNPEIKTLLPQSANKTDAADILDRMVLLMVNEAALILEEGIAATVIFRVGLANRLLSVHFVFCSALACDKSKPTSTSVGTWLAPPAVNWENLRFAI
jgi:hypothetical protein